MKPFSPFWPGASLGILIFLLSCNFKGDPIWNEGTNRVTREVRQTLNAYFDDIVSNGFEAEFKYLDTSAMFKWHPPGYLDSIDYDSVRSILIINATLYKALHMEWDSLVVFPEERNRAKYFGMIHTIMQDTSGNKDTMRLYEEGVMMKREDGWKLVKGKTVRKS